MNRVLIVCGFHRSGTSLITQYLQRCGLYIGRGLLPANESNPEGHFEDREVVRIHDSILSANGESWQISSPRLLHIDQDAWRRMESLVLDRNHSHRTWGFKDPRVCLFASHWKHLVPDAKFLVIYRHPAECVLSLQKRHARDLWRNRGNRAQNMAFFKVPDLALRMWVLHNERLIDLKKAYPDDVVVCSHRNFVAGRRLGKEIAERWGFEFSDVGPEEVFNPELATPPPPPVRVASRSLIERAIGVWKDLKSMERESGDTSTLETTQYDLSHDDFQIDIDAIRTRMENELLRFENDFLKSRATRTESNNDAILADLKYLNHKIRKFPFGLYFRRHKRTLAIYQRYSG